MNKKEIAEIFLELILGLIINKTVKWERILGACILL